MSGGEFNYMYENIRDTYVGKMEDAELDEMMDELSDVLYELEWWQSGDTSEDKYRKAVAKFKKKWFQGDVTMRIVGIVEKKVDALKDELLTMIGAYAGGK